MERVDLKTSFRDGISGVRNWSESNTTKQVDARLAAAGGDSRLPNNPSEDGPNRILPTPDEIISSSDAYYNAAIALESKERSHRNSEGRPNHPPYEGLRTF